MEIRLATRSSRLALIQTELVRDALSSHGVESRLVTHTTHGDRDRTSPIYSMNRTGVFVDELNNLILSGKSDAAVHSAKDIPSSVDSSLEVSAVLPRGFANDVLVSARDLENLKDGAVIGTSSRRRIAEIRSLRRDLVIKDIRGNIDTRLQKLKNGEYDGIIAARAAIERLGIAVTFFNLSIEDFLPAPNQGIIAVVSEKGSEASTTLEGISDQETYRAFLYERRLVSSLELGCSIPAGILCLKSGGSYRLRARFYSLVSDEYREYGAIVHGEGDIDELANEVKATLPAEYGYGFGVR